MSSVAHYHDNKRWYPLLLLLMPDHLHALISFSWENGDGINRVVESWKRYLASKHAVEWQRGYSDHRIRSKKDMDAKWTYIRDNPVRAEQIEVPDEWPYVWRPSGVGW